MKKHLHTCTRGGVLTLALGFVLAVLSAPAFAQVGTSFLIFPETGSGYVEVSHAAALNPPGAITLEAWVFLVDAGSACYSLVGKNFSEAFWVGICAGKVRFYARGGASSRDSLADVPVGRWFHLAVTHDGEVQKFYIDGEPAGEANMGPGPLGTSTAPLRIGSDVSWQVTPRGAIHEVRLWSIARTQAAIQGDRLMRITSARPGLVSVWPLDTDARDVIGSRHGTVVGAARFGADLPLVCPNSYWIATAARVPGAGGSQWYTDLTAFNPGASPVSARLYLLPRDGDNAGVTPLTRTVAAGRALSLPNVVQDTFGQSNLAGAILVCTDEPLVVSSRTYTRDGARTYGFASQATRRESAIAAGQTRRITDVRENAAFRSNLGLTNVTRGTVTVKVKLVLADGTVAGERTYTLKPWSHIQRSRVVREFTGADVAGGTLAIEPSGGAVIAYVAIVDNSTNDSSYIEPMY